MKRLTFALFSMVVACGSTEPPTVTGGGTFQPGTGTGVVVGTGGTGGAGGAGGTGGTGGSVGLCTNDSDLAAIGTGSLVRYISANCAFQCNQDLEYEFCINQCLTQQVQNLSSACAGCYSALEQCAVNVECDVECRNNPCGLGCLQCEGYTGCVGDFQVCSGLSGEGCPR